MFYAHILTQCAFCFCDTATNYIIQLDKSTRQMQTRLAALEAEVQRLRTLNEKISLSVGGTPEAMGGGGPGNGMAGPAGMVHPMDRPLSPPPEGQQQLAPPPSQQTQQATHSLIPVTGEPPREESDGSEGGY